MQSRRARAILHPAMLAMVAWWAGPAAASKEWTPIAALVEESDVVVVGKLVDVQMNRYVTREYEGGGDMDDTRAGDYTQQWWHSGFVEVREWLKGPSWLGVTSKNDDGTKTTRVEVAFFGQGQDTKLPPGTSILESGHLYPREGDDGVWLLDRGGPGRRTCRPHMEWWPLPADSTAYVRRCLEVEVCGCSALPLGLPRAEGSWLVSCGSESREFVHSMATGRDGGLVVAGVTCGDLMVEGRRVLAADSYGVFAAAFGGEGELAGAARLAVSDDRMGASSLSVGGVVVDDDGFVTVTGRFFGKLEIGGKSLKSGRSSAGYVIRRAPDGTVVWARGIGGSVPSDPAAVLAPDGNVVVAATFDGEMGYGRRYLTSRGLMDVALFAVDAGGDPVWMTQVGDARTEWCSGVLIAPDDGFVLFGQSDDTTVKTPHRSTACWNVWIQSFASSGERRWVYRSGADQQAQIRSAAVDGDGGVVACLSLADISPDNGADGGPRPGPRRNVTRRLDADGKLVWERPGGAWSLDIDDRGRILMAGSYGAEWRSIDFPEPEGESDLFIEVLTADGRRLGLWRDGGMSTERIIAARWADDGAVLMLGEHRATSCVAGRTLRPYGDGGFFVGRVVLPQPRLDSGR